MSNVFNSAWLQARGGYAQANDGLAGLQAAYGNQQAAKMYQSATPGMSMQSQRQVQQAQQQPQQAQQQAAYGLVGSEYGSVRGGASSQKPSMRGEQPQGALYDYSMLHSAASAFSHAGKSVHSIPDAHYELMRQQQQQQQQQQPQPQRSPHPQPALSHQSQQRMAQPYDSYPEAAASIPHAHSGKPTVSSHASPSISHQQQPPPGSSTPHGTPQGPALSQAGYAMHSRLAQGNPSAGGSMSNDMLDFEQLFSSVHGGGRTGVAAAGQVHHGYGSPISALDKGLEGGQGPPEVGYHGSREGYVSKAQMAQGVASASAHGRGIRKPGDSRNGMLSPSMSGGVVEEAGMGPAAYGVHAGHVDNIDAYGRPVSGHGRLRGTAVPPGGGGTMPGSSGIMGPAVHPTSSAASEDFLGMAAEAADMFGGRGGQQGARVGVAGAHRAGAWMGHAPTKSTASMAKSPEQTSNTPSAGYLSPESPDNVRTRQLGPQSPTDASQKKRRRLEQEAVKRGRMPPPALQIGEALTPTAEAPHSHEAPALSPTPPPAAVYRPHAKEVEMLPGGLHLYVQEDESEIPPGDTAAEAASQAGPSHPELDNACEGDLFTADKIDRSAATNVRLPPTAALTVLSKLDRVHDRQDVGLLQWLYGREVEWSAICT